jgi:hypothetical protein
MQTSKSRKVKPTGAHDVIYTRVRSARARCIYAYEIFVRGCELWVGRREFRGLKHTYVRGPALASRARRNARSAAWRSRSALQPYDRADLSLLLDRVFSPPPPTPVLWSAAGGPPCGAVLRWISYIRSSQNPTAPSRERVARERIEKRDMHPRADDDGGLRIDRQHLALPV